MELEYSHWTGNFGTVKSTLIRSIAQYIKNYNQIKIGITNNPENRKRKYETDGENLVKMVVKYGTSSVNLVNKMEKDLIEHHWNSITNKVSGGGGPNGATGPYFLYVILK